MQLQTTSRTRRTWLGQVAVSAALTIIVGCGPRRQKVKLKLTHQGKDYIPGKNEYLLVILVPQGAAGKSAGTTFPANPLPDGSFEVIGEGKGIPPGRYHVRIENPMHNSPVAIPEEFASSESPVVREVVVGVEELSPVDLTAGSR